MKKLFIITLLLLGISGFSYATTEHNYYCKLITWDNDFEFINPSLFSPPYRTFNIIISDTLTFKFICSEYPLNLKDDFISEKYKTLR